MDTNYRNSYQSGSSYEQPNYIESLIYSMMGGKDCAEIIVQINELNAEHFSTHSSNYIKELRVSFLITHTPTHYLARVIRKLLTLLNSRDKNGKMLFELDRFESESLIAIFDKCHEIEDSKEREYLLKMLYFTLEKHQVNFNIDQEPIRKDSDTSPFLIRQNRGDCKPLLYEISLAEDDDEKTKLKRTIVFSKKEPEAKPIESCCQCAIS